MLLPTFWAFVRQYSSNIHMLWQFKKLTYFLTSWPSYLPLDLQKVYRSVLSQATYVEVWRWLVKNCDLYRVLHKQTDRQTNKQTNILAKMEFWQVITDFKTDTDMVEQQLHDRFMLQHLSVMPAIDTTPHTPSPDTPTHTDTPSPDIPIDTDTKQQRAWHHTPKNKRWTIYTTRISCQDEKNPRQHTHSS